MWFREGYSVFLRRVSTRWRRGLLLLTFVFPLSLSSLDTAPLLGSDHMFETMTQEIEQLLSKVRLREGPLGVFVLGHLPKGKFSPKVSTTESLRGSFEIVLTNLVRHFAPPEAEFS